MEGDIFSQGVDLMVFGMGVVFVFLTMLVILTSAMSAIIGRCFPGSQSDSRTTRKPVKQGEEQQIISAIFAAIKLHRSRRKK